MMKTGSVEFEGWWAGVEADERAFLRDVARLADSLEYGEVLELAYNGRSFTPTLKSGRRRAEEAERNGRAGQLEIPEVWWAGLAERTKAGMQVLSGLVEELRWDPDKAIEFCRTARGWRATLVLRFRRPVGGKAEVN